MARTVAKSEDGSILRPAYYKWSKPRGLAYGLTADDSEEKTVEALADHTKLPSAYHFDVARIISFPPNGL